MIIEGELKWFGHTLDRDLKELRIIPILDVHYGNPLCSLKHLERVIKIIKDKPEVYTILGGDLCEATTIASKGDIYKQKVCPEMQRDNMIEFLNPIKHKILGMVTGNHEMRIKEIDISKDIAKALNVPYRPEGILLKISFGHGNENHANKYFTYWGYITHGYGGARTKAAKAVKVERVSTWVHADFYCLAHDHVVNVAPDVYLIPDNRGYLDAKTGFMTGKVTAKRKMLVKGNAYLKFGGYSEMGGFPPTDLEPVVIILSGQGKPKVNVGV